MTTAPKSEILNMAALVDYQAGSIVSRQLVKEKGGNITIFAFDKGQELSEHTTPYDALVHILDGEATIIISGKSFLLSTGEGILMPSNIPHAVKAVARFKMLLTMIHDDRN
jgi:quercetin dioxygenase-like cupin family protein